MDSKERSLKDYVQVASSLPDPTADQLSSPASSTGASHGLDPLEAKIGGDDPSAGEYLEKDPDLEIPKAQDINNSSANPKMQTLENSPHQSPSPPAVPGSVSPEHDKATSPAIENFKNDAEHSIASVSDHEEPLGTSSHVQSADYSVVLAQDQQETQTAAEQSLADENDPVATTQSPRSENNSPMVNLENSSPVASHNGSQDINTPDLQPDPCISPKDLKDTSIQDEGIEATSTPVQEQGKRKIVRWQECDPEAEVEAGSKPDAGSPAPSAESGSTTSEKKRPIVISSALDMSGEGHMDLEAQDQAGEREKAAAEASKKFRFYLLIAILALFFVVMSAYLMSSDRG